MEFAHMTSFKQFQASGIFGIMGFDNAADYLAGISINTAHLKFL